jgi:hypothetical protein
MKLRLVEAQFFSAGRQTDVLVDMTKMIVAFLQFYELAPEQSSEIS